jgi:hypothetical protein
VERLDQFVRNSRIEDALSAFCRVFNANREINRIPDVARLATFLLPLRGYPNQRMNDRFA